MSRVADMMVQPSKVQTHNSSLDGTTGRGKFTLHTSMQWLTVLCHSDSALNWDISIIPPNPGDPGNPISYKWLSLGAQSDIIDSPQVPLPQGTVIEIKTNNVADANPRVQIVTKLFGDESR